MNRKNEFRRLFRESFSVDPRWTEWFMNEVYTDSEALLLEVDGKAVSTMLLSAYPFAFGKTEIPAVYISCVATARAERGKGLMHRLFPSALNEAVARGYAVATLIPSDHRLYFFYDHFGFSTVFYVNEQRYTALHKFPSSGNFAETPPRYELFRRLENEQPCGIRHSELRFRQVVDDYRLSGGLVTAVEDAEGRGAIAFVQVGSQARVIALLADNEEAAQALLAVIRERVGNIPVIVMGIPDDTADDFITSPTIDRSSLSLTSHGMARIIDVQTVLSALAAADKKINQVVRVHDPLIASNNGVFTLRDGECEATPDTSRRVTLDVDISVLTRLLFSAPAVGRVFDLPTSRPVMSLMLE